MMSTETHSLDIEALRADTPGCAHRAHLNNAGAALMSRSTLAAITGHLDLEARIGGYEAAEAAGEAIAGTYAGLARLVGGEPSQIALFDNSTRAWNAAFYSIPFQRGDHPHRPRRVRQQRLRLPPGRATHRRRGRRRGNARSGRHRRAGRPARRPGPS